MEIFDNYFFNKAKKDTLSISLSVCFVTIGENFHAKDSIPHNFSQSFLYGGFWERNQAMSSLNFMLYT